MRGQDFKFPKATANTSRVSRPKSASHGGRLPLAAYGGGAPQQVFRGVSRVGPGCSAIS